MALKTFGYRGGKRFGESKKDFGSTESNEKGTYPRNSARTMVKLVVGSATAPEVMIIETVGPARLPSGRAAMLRSKVDQAIRDSDAAREKAKVAGEMVVVVG
ncbi:hypothetical protein RN01_07350 [Cupriavidus sp. SHE]|jgi:hypothetical protein|uniref:Uncharacterized protein n=1 Tax=Cupriavidus metallidurans TaxID=119219 RepID=A0A482IPR9_9BURK|nr:MULTISPECIES: hypothetical protein [Cupriavidus]KWR84313.1 hypothetical protein RN01_07350 [Cupriavidus sp. SHE]QBP09936.1 hypothetical protein DDF84_009250 [Cupriavidus metallidurans]